MVSGSAARPNVRQAAPFFHVTDIENSLRFCIEGLGFVLKNKWTPEGRIRWCWLELGEAAIMLQEYWRDGQPAGAPEGPLGQGVSVCFLCVDAMAVYHEFLSRGVSAARPFVGNGLWVTAEAPTPVPSHARRSVLRAPVTAQRPTSEAGQDAAGDTTPRPTRRPWAGSAPHSS